MQPRLFISYAWSTQEHQDWLVRLATDLSSAGIEILMDIYDLREGDDTFAYMERLVTDPTVTKVLLVCDQRYRDKADARAGGVGTETSIVTPEIYGRVSQDKFVAIVAEYDEQGKPCLPAFLRSRKYIDLSSADRYSENFETLVRWAFDKPLHRKPEIGRPPSYITEERSATSLHLRAHAQRAMEQLRAGKPSALGAATEYLEEFSARLERLRLSRNDAADINTRIVDSIGAFRDDRDECLAVIACAAQYVEAARLGVVLHEFFERLMPYFGPSAAEETSLDCEFDNLKFVVHELFLHTVAVLIRARSIDAIASLLGDAYYLPENARNSRQSTTDFSFFVEYLPSIDRVNRATNRNRVSLHADMLKERCDSGRVSFQELMQADLVCFVRADLADFVRRWSPQTLIFAGRQYNAFEFFARATSKARVAAVLSVLGAQSVEKVGALLNDYEENRRSLPKWQFEQLAPLRLIGFSDWGIRP